ncbi:MAG: TonB-dependent receptor [Pyrinomonadaceae bacterium]
MRKYLNILMVLVLIALGQLAIYAQTTGSIAGTVVDQTGAVVPNATVTVKGESGQEFTAVTSENGTYRIPAVASGLYTVTVTSTTGFKTFVVSNVKVDVGTPSTVDAALEVGGQEQIVEIQSGGEVLQTETATVATTITGRQINETPVASRNALDLVNLLPGVAQVGRPRTSSINGLPKGSLSITLDGADAQDNNNRSSDGFFTIVQPKIDAIEEVTVSTANPGAESSGDGAVQVKFVTKRGTNEYRGGLFEQVRNTSLNAANFFNNRDLRPLPGSDKAPRTKLNLNQFGGRLGGPLPFPNFGEGGPVFHSGKDRLFFFFNYEQFRQPESLLRTRTVLTPQAQAGVFSYIVGTETRTVNLFDLARRNNQLATPDPTVGSVLARIASATTSGGSLTPITNNPNRQNFNFNGQGGQTRKFLALRFDANLNKNNSAEFVMNRQNFASVTDFLNSVDAPFPGFQQFSQGSKRNSYVAALRSTLTNNLVNEARYSKTDSPVFFFPEATPQSFDFQGGFNLGIGAAGITSATTANGTFIRNTPVDEFTDTVSLSAGNHSISFGGQYKLIRSITTNQSPIVPSVTFGLDATDPASTIFANSATSLPGASAAQLAEARALYAVLIGRVSGVAQTAFLGEDGTFANLGIQTQRGQQKTFGLFAQDSWRIRPNLSVNYGLRWQPQSSFIATTSNFSRLENFDQIFGVSGPGNLFRPGTLTGTVPRVVAVQPGEESYPTDYNNFAPSVGVVYSPDFGEKGILRSVFGSTGKSVFRGGYSLSFVREGFALFGSIFGSNPGGFINTSRNPLIAGSFTVGTNLRDANNINLTPAPFPLTPTFPRNLTAADSANTFSPDLKTGKVHSFSAGYQRELDKNTVIEFRYVGNRGVGLQRLRNINEFNTIENGFAAEFRLAQANLLANQAAGRGATFAFFGAGTGTSPLPISLAFINPNSTFNPNNPASYNSALFADSGITSTLSPNAANVLGFAGSIEGSAIRRANAIANGLPSNFVRVNPTVPGGAFIVDNTLDTSYDSGVIELRRRLSNGLRVQANYVFSKALSNAYASSGVVFSNLPTQREGGSDLARGPQAFDIRHQFKLDVTYDLPFGKGRTFFSNANGFVNSLVGGFTILPVIRWQSGSPFSLGNVTLVGMTRKELQKEIKVRKDTVINGVGVVTYLPDDIILNSQRAFDIDVSNTTGFGTAFGGTAGIGTAPTGRFIAPAGAGNCQSRFAGECGFNNLIIYGPSFFKLDVTLAKKFNLGEKRSIELRALALDALNRPNFRVGGFNADVVGVFPGGSTFGQLGAGTAYNDLGSQDPGGRIIDLMIRFNF